MNHPTPNSNCVPCQKEELCGSVAKAMINTGHQYMLMGAWSEDRLDEWNEFLDSFINLAETMLKDPAPGRREG